jgi:hypothetical protein
LRRASSRRRSVTRGLPVTADPPDAFRARIAREVLMYKEIIDRRDQHPMMIRRSRR